MKVAILGAGPAGLMAAWACKQSGAEFDILSQGGPSQIIGAQYLHIPIPGVTEHVESRGITYLKRGKPDGYAYKAYGDPAKKSSWDRWKQGILTGWPLSQTYELMWGELFPRIHGIHIDRLAIMELYDHGYDLVASTIPPRAYCGMPDEHEFLLGQSFIVEEEPTIPEWTIIYDGTRDNAYHRLSHLEGRQWAEYGTPVFGAELVTKPQATTCGCMPQVLRLGRFGKWKRDELVSDAYTELRRYLGALLEML